MDGTDHIIERARRAPDATQLVRPGDRALRSVLPVLDSLRHRGLSYAMDRYRPETLAGAAETARHFACPDLDGVLGGAAHIARTCHGRRLSSAIDAYDRRYTVRGLDAALREAVAAWRQRQPDAFRPPVPGDDAGTRRATVHTGPDPTPAVGCTEAHGPGTSNDRSATPGDPSRPP